MIDYAFPLIDLITQELVSCQLRYENFEDKVAVNSFVEDSLQLEFTSLHTVESTTTLQQFSLFHEFILRLISFLITIPIACVICIVMFELNQVMLEYMKYFLMLYLSVHTTVIMYCCIFIYAILSTLATYLLNYMQQIFTICTSI